MLRCVFGSEGDNDAANHYSTNILAATCGALSLLALGMLFAFKLPAAGTNQEVRARNVILFVGDGMGPEHVNAARAFLGGPLSFEHFPYHSDLGTDSATVSGPTDSAAGATAMSTGMRVYNGVISLALPGDGRILPTALEGCQARGKSSGLVTTSYMTDATPGAFAAHEESRTEYAAIAGDYLNDSRPNVLFGGGDRGLSPNLAQSAGYQVVTDTGGLLALNGDASQHVSGQFGSGEMPSIYDGRGNLPTLSQMTNAALALLSRDSDGFFLLVEQEGTDTYAHMNNITRTVHAAIELDEAVTEALEWSAGRADTLILVTADHETGGLTLLADNGPGNMPSVGWATAGHTDTRVPVYGMGPAAQGIEVLAAQAHLTDLASILDRCGYTGYLPFVPSTITSDN